MPDKETDQRFDQLAERLIHQHWDFYPTAGSRIGRHEYDGRLPDLAPDRLRRRIGELRRGLTQLSEISPRAMEPDRLLSYRLLELFLKREIFTLAEWRPLESNPIRQVGFLNVGGYVRRNYAPLADRLRAATQALDQAPDFLASLDSTLAPELGRPVLEMSIESYTGMARFYRVDLAEAVRDFHDPGILNEFNRARETAAAAIDHFAERLKARLERASADFAIGPRLYAGMLATGEGMELPLSQLEKLGQENLDHNLEQLAEVASGLAPGREVRDIVAEISRRHPTAEGLIPETRDMLEAIREAVTDLALVTIPSEDRCQVIETPTYMRYAFAAMDSPGSLETRATESFYYVTPVEEDWSPQEQEEWLSNFNYNTLRIVSVHEVYPGHFVHHLHNRYGRDLPLVNRVATSYAFTEGWAHYTEQMILETEFGRGQPSLAITQLLEALVRNCRYQCSLGMHTRGMSVEEATHFFMDHAYMAELPARREALRGTFDPGYLNYTLGKLMILKLRDDYRREQGSAYSLREFHDRLLSCGAPALPLLREAMLAEPGTSPL